MSAGSVSRPLTFLFMPESAYGPTNNCVGIGDVLLRRGHRVVFAAEASWRGQAGGRWVSRRTSSTWHRRPSRPGRGRGQTPAPFWKEFIRDTAPEFRKPTVEQLETFMAPTWQALVDGARYCEPQLREIIARPGRTSIVERQRGGVPGAR